MIVWRLSVSRHLKTAFSGEGARRYGGRWNSPGRPLVYASSSLALASLELLVHLSDQDFPGDLFAIPAEIPDSTEVRILQPGALPKNWRATPAPNRCRDFGDAWLAAAETAVLSVPSALVPQERNLLLNPLHPAMRKVVIGKAEHCRLDPRLR